METNEKTVNINTHYPDDLHAFLVREAREQSRSMHSLIIWILRQYQKEKERSING